MPKRRVTDGVTHDIVYAQHRLVQSLKLLVEQHTDLHCGLGLGGKAVLVAGALVCLNLIVDGADGTRKRVGALCKFFLHRFQLGELSGGAFKVVVVGAEAKRTVHSNDINLGNLRQR